MRVSRISLALALLLAVAGGATTSAHRLDEYLQAARIDLQRDAVLIEMVLTPGAEIADSVVAALDRDGDAQLSRDEQDSYARDVIQLLRLTVDEISLPLQVSSSTFPTIDALRNGEGMIRLRLRAPHDALVDGAHRLSFSNGYFARHGVYLANALAPVSADIAVAEQRRTSDQRQLTIHYTVGPALASVGASWALLGLVVVLLLVRFARRHGIARE